MKNRPLWFSGLLIAVCALVCLFAYPITTTLTVYSTEQKMTLLEAIQRPLEALAIEQARIVDPNYSWIQYQQELPPEIENAVRESALSNQTSLNGNLASDTNLAWSLRYNGKTVNHFWNDEYDNEPGTLDITFTSNGEQVTFTNNSSDGLESKFALFNKDNRVVINPALVSQEGDSNEFVYYLVLPENFSIRFYIPSKLHANGGMIARTAAKMDTESVTFCLSAGLFTLFLFILFWNKQIEADCLVFRRFKQIKALWAWLILAICCTGLTMGIYAVTQYTASGELRENLYALGMRFSQLNWFLPLLWMAVWMFCQLAWSMLMLYVKYILAFGLVRYLKEDTLTSQLTVSGQSKISEAVHTPLETWTWARLLPGITGFCLFIIASMGAGWLLFSWIGALAVLLLDMAMVIILARRMYILLHSDYVTTLAAANELVEGNFSQIRPQQVGAFQKLYNSLVAVKDGFQTALKDGLASQNMKTQLISNVSHDLKTPVTGIKSYAELISMASSLDQVQEYSRRLINYTDRLNALITDLFDVAKANSGDIQLNKVHLNLAELILQVEGEWADTLAKAELQVVLELPDVAMTTLDADKTMRIIDNLMGNISKYAMPGTRVFISLQEIPGEFVLVCKNISKTPLDFKPDEITERFVRGDKSRHEPGSGLGLAIVKSFMEVQGGSFSVEIDGDVFKAILVFPKVELDPSHGKLNGSAAKNGSAASPMESTPLPVHPLDPPASALPAGSGKPPAAASAPALPAAPAAGVPEVPASESKGS